MPRAYFVLILISVIAAAAVTVWIPTTFGMAFSGITVLGVVILAVIVRLCLAKSS